MPYIESRNRSAQVEHEATTSKISEDQLFYCRQRGIRRRGRRGPGGQRLLPRGAAGQLPMEFAVEAQKLVGISLEGSVG